jgi:hypothetical protein
MSRFARLLADRQNSLSRNRTLGSLAGEEPSGGSIAFPVSAQEVEQFGREHDVAVLVALSLTDTDELALAVDVGHPQMGSLGNPQAGGVDGQLYSRFRVNSWTLH